MIDSQLNEVSKFVHVRPSPNPSDLNVWCNGNDYQADSLDLKIHQELIDFAKFLAPSPIEKHIRLLAINKYRTAISLIWPDAKMICHGSTATTTNLPDSDLDFVVFNAPTNQDDISLLRHLEDNLLEKKIIRNSKVINARCPIIKCTDNIYGFNVDIAVNNENGILNIKRHNMYMKEYPGIFPVLMFTKFFLRQHHLDTPYDGGISSNTLIQMIIFIIQMLDKSERLNCGKILLKFLLYYGGSFNYITTGISTREGGRTFEKLKLYRVNWSTPVCLSIEDPQIPGNFLGENAFNTYTFRQKCSDGYLKLISSKSFYEQSLLNRLINHITLRSMSKFRKSILDKFISICGNLISSLPDEESALVRRHNAQPKNSYNKEVRYNFTNYKKPPYKR